MENTTEKGKLKTHLERISPMSGKPVARCQHVNTEGQQCDKGVYLDDRCYKHRRRTY